MIERVRLEPRELERILGRVRDVRIYLVGDVCVDIYWRADMRRSELSRETPHHPLPVVEERVSLGAGGNVAAVMRDLGARVMPVSAIGRDWRGQLLRNALEDRGVSLDGLVDCEGRLTPAYCKPMRMGISGVVYEDPRLDFENWQPLTARQEDELIHALRRAAADADVIAVADQFRYGVVSEAVRRELSAMAKAGRIVVVDSRDRASEYSGMIIKPNELEAAKAVGIAPAGVADADAYAPVALQLSGKMGSPAIVTLGKEGALWADGGAVFHAPGHAVPPPIDIVGAGDAFLGALCCALAAGAPGQLAIAFANVVSAVTVQKIGTTGTATPGEVRREYARGGA